MDAGIVQRLALPWKFVGAVVVHNGSSGKLYVQQNSAVGRKFGKVGFQAEANDEVCVWIARIDRLKVALELAEG